MIEQDRDDVLTAKRCRVVADNALGHQQLRWLIAQVGEPAVIAAVSKLTGRRLAYPTNIARVLKLSMPLAFESPAELPATRTESESDIRAALLAAAERQSASNMDAAERNQRALAAEQKVAAAEFSRKLAALRVKWNLPPRPQQEPPGPEV